MLDLGGILKPVKPQDPFHEFIGPAGPVLVREGYLMCIEITGCTPEFGAERNSDQLFDLILDPFHEYKKFFTQNGWRCRLSMGPRQHGYLHPICRKQFQLLIKVQEERQVFNFDCMFPEQGDGGIVDVLRSQPEMNPFLQMVRTEFLELFFQKIFNRLDIMIGCLFNLLDLSGIFHAEILIYRKQLFLQIARKGKDLFLSKEYEIFHFYQHPVFHQGIF